MPTPDSGDDFVWVCGPGEGFGIIVGLRDEAVDGGLEFDNAPEDTALQSLLGKFGEEALDGVEPRARGRRKVEGEARMPVEPLTHLRMLVGGIVIEDHVHELSSGHLGLDSIQEADELLVTMALHTSANDLAFEHVESSKQRRCAVALIVMGHSAGPALLHGQAGLGSVEGLDLRLFVDRKHDGMGGRVDVEPHNIAQLVDELRIGGELKLPDPVRLKAMRAPDSLHRTCADTDGFRHHCRSPVGRLNGRIGPGERYDTLGDIRTKGWDARRSGLVAQEALIASLHEAFLPAPHTGLRLTGLAHDLVGADAARAQQDDLSTPDMLVRGVAIPRQRGQTAAISGLESDGNSSSHAPDSHVSSPSGIPYGIQMSDLIH
jgi:hypothetical protein